MTVILFLINLTTGATTVQEFNTYDACTYAAGNIMQTVPNAFTAVCTPKTYKAKSGGKLPM